MFIAVAFLDLRCVGIQNPIHVCIVCFAIYMERLGELLEHIILGRREHCEIAGWQSYTYLFYNVTHIMRLSLRSTCVKYLWNMVCVRCFKYGLSDLKVAKYEMYLVNMCLWKRKEKLILEKLQIFYTHTNTYTYLCGKICVICCK